MNPERHIQFLILEIVHSINDSLMSASYEGVLMKNLEACMQQGVATLPTTVGAPCIAYLSMVEGCATTPFKVGSLITEQGPNSGCSRAPISDATETLFT